MAGKVPAKSILKQPVQQKAPTFSSERKEKAEKNRRNLQIALHHAYRIENQKDIETEILNSITLLIDYPVAERFSTKEAVRFIELVKPFQPSDYDSLIEERRIDGKCAYALCSKPPRSQTMGRSAEWKLKQGMGDWCSNDCAKKGLYVKAQLSEVPAWERGREQQPEILLHEEDRPHEEDTAVRRAKRAARVNAWRQKVANEEDLAAERGEKPTSFRPNQVMADTIVEKAPRKPPRTPDADIEEFLTGGSIEGFQPKRIGKGIFSKPQDNAGDSDDDR